MTNLKIDSIAVFSENGIEVKGRIVGVGFEGREHIDLGIADYYWVQFQSEKLPQKRYPKQVKRSL